MTRIVRLILSLAIPVALVMAFLMPAAAAASAGAIAGSGPGPAANSLCGKSGTPPQIQHVILVMLENESYGTVIGDTADAPYQNGTLKADCGVATEMFGATHYSAANYFAVSGGTYSAQSAKGCANVPQCQIPANSNGTPTDIYEQLHDAGLTWKAYEESMYSTSGVLTNCEMTDNDVSPYWYKIGHNPPIFYQDVTSTGSQCINNDVAVASLDSTSGEFYDNLKNNNLPSFSWITPDTQNDGENSTCTNTTQIPNCKLYAADTWLSNFIPIVAASPEYQAGNTLVLITYDEGSAKYGDYAEGEDCTNKTKDLAGQQESCHLPFFVVYPYTKAGSTDSAFFDHYSDLHTIEQLFSLSYLNNAAGASTLVGHFGIP